MADADGPRDAVGVAAAKIEIAAGVDGKVPERLQLARGRVHGEPLRDGAEVQRQRAAERDRSSIRIHMDVPIAGARHRAGTASGLSGRSDARG